MKKILILILISFVLAGCTTNRSHQSLNKNTVEVDVTKETTSENDQISLFNIGMSIKDVKSNLNKLGIRETNEIEVTSSPEDPRWGNKCIWTEKFVFEFDKNMRLYQIGILDNTPTSLGLINGDSKEQMEKLYGKSYTSFITENGNRYEYDLVNKFLNVYFENGKIVQWTVSDKETELLYKKSVATGNNSLSITES